MRATPAGIAAALALLPSWLGLPGSWHWLLDLLAHFRWQYLVVAAVVCVWAAWRRSRPLLLAAVATLLLNAVLIGQLALPRTQPALVPDFELRVLSLNVRTSNADHAAVLGHVRQAQADVVLLMEVDQTWARALAALQDSYPFHMVEARSDNFGIALYSRLRLDKARLADISGNGLPTVVADLQHQGRTLRLIGTHPLPPVSALHAELRDRQLEAAAALAGESTAPVLLVGDLNATPWSHGLRVLRRGQLEFGPVAAPWVPTWLPRTPFAIPIDHALGSAPLVITGRSVGPDVGSDHRPLLVTVRWASAGG